MNIFGGLNAVDFHLEYIFNITALTVYFLYTKVCQSILNSVMQPLVGVESINAAGKNLGSIRSESTK